MHKINEELWSYEDDYLYKIKTYPYNEKVENVDLDYIDRGVNDFEEFGQALLYTFPNLKKLKWSQNYTCYKNKTGEEVWLEFLKFIKMMELTKLYLIDTQSKFLMYFNKDELLNNMPINSTYTFEFEGNTKKYVIKK